MFTSSICYGQTQVCPNFDAMPTQVDFVLVRDWGSNQAQAQAQVQVQAEAESQAQIELGLPALLGLPVAYTRNRHSFLPTSHALLMSTKRFYNNISAKNSYANISASSHTRFIGYFCYVTTEMSCVSGVLGRKQPHLT